MDSFFYLVMFAGAVAGASIGLLGVYIVGMRMPFIGICISHSAMAGTIYSILLGVNPVLGPIIFSAISSMSLGVVRPGRSRIDANVALAIFFNLMLGLTFLGIGLMQGSRSEVLGLLWGSLLFVRKSSVVIITISGLVFVVFAALFNKELKVLLFSRTIASATGVHESFVYCLADDIQFNYVPCGGGVSNMYGTQVSYYCLDALRDGQCSDWLLGLVLS
jgi:manganese/iron transport system permease protein